MVGEDRKGHKQGCWCKDYGAARVRGDRHAHTTHRSVYRSLQLLEIHTYPSANIESEQCELRLPKLNLIILPLLLVF